MRLIFLVFSGSAVLVLRTKGKWTYSRTLIATLLRAFAVVAQSLSNIDDAVVTVSKIIPDRFGDGNGRGVRGPGYRVIVAVTIQGAAVDKADVGSSLWDLQNLFAAGAADSSRMSRLRLRTEPGSCDLAHYRQGKSGALGGGIESLRKDSA